MILFHRIRYLFLGWKRFTHFIQTALFVLLGALFGGMTIYGVMNQAWDEGRWAIGVFYAISLLQLFYLNKKDLGIARIASFMALIWTTLIWMETLLPGMIHGSLGLIFIRKLGYEYLCLTAFSVISLFGLGYPFAWLGKSRIGVMIGLGLSVSLIGFLLLSGFVEFERVLDYSYSIHLSCISLFLVIFGAVILVRGIQECIEKGMGYWPQIPYAAASIMFLFTMVLWSAFHIHEQQIWSRELQSYTIKIGDRLEHKLNSLRLDLERLNRIYADRKSIRQREWSEAVGVFLEDEKAVLGVDRFPQGNSEWKVVAPNRESLWQKIPHSIIQEPLSQSRGNDSLWISSVFPLSDQKKGIALFSRANFFGEKNNGIWMGIDFESLFKELFYGENPDIDFQVRTGEEILCDFEVKRAPLLKNYLTTEIFFHGTRFGIEATPKAAFFQKRDRYLSICFFVAGLIFSILFGTLIGLYIHLHHDSLELREINERLGMEIEDRRKVEREGEQKNRDLETLIYVVSHDLREPLRGIESFSRLIYERYLDRLDEKGQDFLRRIVFSSMRLDRLLDDIAMLSRVQRAEVPDSPVNGRELVMEALSRLETISKAKNANITVDRDLPFLWVNRTWGTQAIFNLIGNALKFTNPNQEPEILVKAYRSENGEQEGVQVLDRGPGVRPEHVGRIFKLFQRAVGREVEGTGAGLAIVKQIAERHGGAVFYEDREGGGGCFTLTFAKRERALIVEEERL